MKKFITTILLVAAGLSSFAQLSQPPSGDNQKSAVTQWIGLVGVTINYSSPDVHGAGGEDRKGHIWGELVHYGFADQGYGPSKAAPWRAGANENTTITFTHDVQVGGKPLKAGTYGLFLDVEKEGAWQWIFSSDAAAWGSYYYDEKHDALRVTTQPSEHAYEEYLTFGFDERLPKSATAFLAWENKKASFKIEVPNVDELYVAKMREEITGTTMGFSNAAYKEAAQFCAQRKVQLEQGLKWAEAAISEPYIGVKDFSTLQTKAMVLNAMGRDNDSETVMAEAIRLPSASVPDIHDYGRYLISSGQHAKALEVFQYNRKTHPDDKFTTYVGLARGYTATGDKKNALKNWEMAINNLPKEQEPNRKAYEAEIQKLKG